MTSHLHRVKDLEIECEVLSKRLRAMVVALQLIKRELQPPETAAPSPDEGIEGLGLSIRAYNGLKRAGVGTVGELTALAIDDLLEVNGLGDKCVTEVRETLQRFGLSLSAMRAAG